MTLETSKTIAILMVMVLSIVSAEDIKSTDCKDYELAGYKPDIAGYKPDIKEEVNDDPNKKSGSENDRRKRESSQDICRKCKDKNTNKTLQICEYKGKKSITQSDVTNLIENQIHIIDTVSTNQIMNIIILIGLALCLVAIGIVIYRQRKLSSYPPYIEMKNQNFDETLLNGINA